MSLHAYAVHEKRPTDAMHEKRLILLKRTLYPKHINGPPESPAQASFMPSSYPAHIKDSSLYPGKLFIQVSKIGTSTSIMVSAESYWEKRV